MGGCSLAPEKSSGTQNEGPGADRGQVGCVCCLRAEPLKNMQILENIHHAVTSRNKDHIQKRAFIDRGRRKNAHAIRFHGKGSALLRHEMDLRVGHFGKKLERSCQIKQSQVWEDKKPNMKKCRLIRSKITTELWNRGTWPIIT